MHSYSQRARQAAAALACAGALMSACGTAPDRALQRQRAQELYGQDEPRRTVEDRDAELPVLTEQSTADDYVRYGLLRNPSIRATFESWRASLERVPQVSELPDPSFGFMIMGEDVQTRTGPQENRFALRQMLPWPGKLGARGDVAAAEAESLWWKVEAQRRMVTLDIRKAYYDYAYLARDLRITTDLLALLRGLEPVVQRRVQAGAGQQELLQLQVEIGKLEDGLATLEQYRPALSARLSSLLNRPQWTVLPLPELREPHLETRFSQEDADRAVREGNPELKELTERIRRETVNRDLADLEGLPDLTVGVDYILTGEALTPGTPGSGDDPWGVTFEFNLPIWRSKYNALEREAEAAQAAARETWENRSNALRGDGRLALYRIDDALRKVRLYRDTLLPRARQSLQVTETAYRAGNATLLDLIDRQRALLAFEQSYWRACADHGQARADLEALTGGLL